MKQPITPDVPGIDDCDHLFSLTSPSGCSSVYIRVQQHGSVYYAAGTVDSDAPEGPNDCSDFPLDEGPFDSPDTALLHNVEAAREWFRDNGLRYVYCNDTRKIVAADRRRHR